MLPETLDKLLSTSLTLITAIISLYVVVKFVNKRSQPLPLEIMNHVVLVFFILWFVAYALATHMELDAMKKVFDSSVLPGLSVSYGILAFSFSVLFALLIITHRNMYLSFAIVMALGFSDLYGNLEIITGMQHIIQSHSLNDTVMSGAERIWVSYYLSNPQLLRISLYMMLCYVGFSIFVLSKYKVIQSESGEVEYSNLAISTSSFCQKHKVSLEVVGKLIFVLALLLNEITMFSWRYEREKMFIQSGNKDCSGYVEWSARDFYKFNNNESAKDEGNCDRKIKT